MSYQVTIYSKEEREAFHNDKSQHGFVAFYTYERHGTNHQFEGLLRPLGNMVTDKQWFNTCLHSVRTVPRINKNKEIEGYGLSEAQFIEHYREENRCGFYGTLSGSSMQKFLGNGRRIAKEMGWAKAFEMYDKAFQKRKRVNIELKEQGIKP